MEQRDSKGQPESVDSDIEQHQQNEFTEGWMASLELDRLREAGIDEKDERFVLARGQLTPQPFVLPGTPLVNNLPELDFTPSPEFPHRRIHSTATVKSASASESAASMDTMTSPASAVANSTPPEPQVKTVDRGWTLKRAALIEKHKNQWPTIARDLQDASENQLSKAAKATGHGDWFEADALKWAEQRGKLTKVSGEAKPVQATPFTGLTHKIKG